MSSRPTTYEAADPENKWLWRQNRRRLEVESLRDSILTAGNSLNRQFDGVPDGTDSLRRTVYQKINRAALLDFLSTFDYVETANHLEQRPVTTVPNQALYLMNNPLVHDQAIRLSKSLQGDRPERIDQIWRKLFGRPPHKEEVTMAVDFIADLPKDSDGWAILCRTLIAGSGFSYVE